MLVNCYNSGLEKFIQLCEKENVTESDIDQLLQDDSYNKTIELMGTNWGIGLHDDWKNIFKAAFLNEQNDLNNNQKMCVEHIVNAKNNVDKLVDLNHRINNLIQSQAFIELVNEYAFIRDIDSIDVHLLIFGPNAGGNQAIVVDVFFLESFSDEEITRILAHELHHIVRSKQEVEYEVESNFEDILQMAYWFETEGCANLCNFEETNKLYEIFGYAKKESTAYYLNNMKFIMKDISSLIIDLYKNNENSLYHYLYEYCKFHAIGYHMASTIFNFSSLALKSTVGDPLKFIHLYQTVCEDENLKFSHDAIVIINEVLKVKEQKE